MCHADGFVPKERYTTRDFTELEQARLWPRVWQIACREEQVAGAGDFVEYTVGNEGVAIVRSESGALHRSTTRVCTAGGGWPRAAARSKPARSGARITAGATRSTVASSTFPTATSSRPAGRPRARAGTGRHVGRLRVRQSRPRRRAVARLPRSAAHAARAVSPRPDAIPRVAEHDHRRELESGRRHVQRGLPRPGPAHADPAVDRRREYRVRTVRTARALRTSRRHARASSGRVPRLQLQPDDYDEGEILANMVGGLGGAFLAEEHAAIEDVRARPDRRRDRRCSRRTRRAAYSCSRGAGLRRLGTLARSHDERRRRVLVSECRRADLSGSAILFRVRPYGHDPDRSIKDTWVLDGTPGADDERRVQPKFYADWRDRNWGEITEQDYENLANVQKGMHSAGWTGARLNTQEGNILHMHQVDRSRSAAREIDSGGMIEPNLDRRGRRPGGTRSAGEVDAEESGRRYKHHVLCRSLLVAVELASTTYTRYGSASCSSTTRRW